MRVYWECSGCDYSETTHRGEEYFNPWRGQMILTAYCKDENKDENVGGIHSCGSPYIATVELSNGS